AAGPCAAAAGCYARAAAARNAPAASGPGARAAASAERRRDLRSQVARRADTRDDRRVLRPRQVRDPRRCARGAAEGRRLAETMDEHAGDRRRPLRLAWQRAVQPRARVAPRQRREGLPDEPRRAGEPRHRREQGEGTAVLHGRDRILLAAEPAWPFHCDGEINLAARIRINSSSAIRYFAAFLPST